MKIKAVSIQVSLGLLLMGGTFTLPVQQVHAQIQDSDTSGPGNDPGIVAPSSTIIVVPSIPLITTNEYVAIVSNILNQLDSGTYFDPESIPVEQQQILANVLIDPTDENQQALIDLISEQFSPGLAEDLVNLITDVFDDVDDSLGDDGNQGGESNATIPFGISHVIYQLEDGTTFKVDGYGGDIKDASDPLKYIEAIQEQTGQSVIGYTIKAGPNHYDAQGNQVPDIPNQADIEVSASSLETSDDDFTDDLEMRIDQAQKLSDAIETYNDFIQSLDTEVLENPPTALLAIQAILTAASEATQVPDDSSN
ncbi:MAG: hypothetical protein RI580_01075 [Halothece sp. Uz-M2-17]|nr:hypothetical protein [Halothece sp. Uz-M2-17]